MSDQIETLMRDVDEAVLDAFDVTTREEAREQAGSRRDAYERELTATREMAGKSETKSLAKWLQSEIREKERFPPDSEVRERAAKICRDSGYEVAPSDWPGT